MNKIFQCADEIAKSLTVFLPNKIENYQVVITSSVNIEIKLLVKDIIDEETEIFSKKPFSLYKNAIIITQFLKDDYEDDFIAMVFEGKQKINYNFRRNLSYLINPPKKIVANNDVPVVSFYSYKGGIGRTTSLACFASYMAMFHNKRVVIVDCDFEAPGFSNGNYFFMDKNESQNGIVEYLLDKEFLGHLGQKPNLKEDYCISEVNTAGSADTSFTKKDEVGQGEIYIIPSGNTHRPQLYLETLARIDWGHDLANFIQDIKESFGLDAQNGLILFDSRTGFNDTFAAIANYSHVLVGLFGVNKQNEPGISFFVEHFYEKGEKDVFFIKGLSEFGEEEELQKMIENILLKKPEKPDFALSISHIDNGIKELQFLGTDKVNPKQFREFLLKIDKNDSGNLRTVFESIQSRLKKKDSFLLNNEKEVNELKEDFKEIEIIDIQGATLSEKINKWKENTSPEMMWLLKKSMLSDFKVPTLSGADYPNDELAHHFYFRVPMHDVFHKDKFIILGSKGAGKTYWYRILEERFEYNQTALNNLCRLANKKVANHIFVNIIDAKKPSLAFQHKYKNSLPENEMSSFWLLYTHYALFNHPSILKLINYDLYEKLQDIKNNSFEDWLDAYIDGESYKIKNQRFREIENNLKKLDKELLTYNKRLILSYDQLDFVIPVNQWSKSISPLVNYWRFHQFKQFLPKIFMRSDLYEKISAINKLELNKTIINIQWSKDEIFAYFFKIFLYEANRRNSFYQYLLCYYKEKKDIGKFILALETEYNQYQQILNDEETLKLLVVPLFAQYADFYETDNPQMPNSYDWFIENLKDALNQTNIRSFWTLIKQSVASEIQRKKIYPLISPRFYTEKSNRELAAKAYYGELETEKGNEGLKDFLHFYQNSVELKDNLKVYQVGQKDFEDVIKLFIKKYPNNIQDLISEKTVEEQIHEVIQWLLANGIVGKQYNSANYNFPYLYRSLFDLKSSEY